MNAAQAEKWLRDPVVSARASDLYKAAINDAASGARCEVSAAVRAGVCLSLYAAHLEERLADAGVEP